MRPPLNFAAIGCRALPRGQHIPNLATLATRVAFAAIQSVRENRPASLSEI